MSKVICVLYPDPVDGYPKSYVRDDLPKLTHYSGGQTLPTPKEIDFVPGHLLGSVSGELGLRKFIESQGYKLIVTADKDGPNSVFERELAGGNRSLRSIQARLSNSCWREPLHSAVEHRPLLATRKAGLEDHLRISFPQSRQLIPRTRQYRSRNRPGLSTRCARWAVWFQSSWSKQPTKTTMSWSFMHN